MDLKEIIINNLVEGVFYSLLVCERQGETIEIDSRTSDAIAMAVRFQCPIFTYEEILEKAGVEIEDDSDSGSSGSGSSSGRRKRGRSKSASAKTATSAPAQLSSYSIKDLQTMLDETLANENYERAAKIRDEIQRREGKS